jgi:hypothetical protein
MQDSTAQPAFGAPALGAQAPFAAAPFVPPPAFGVQAPFAAAPLVAPQPAFGSQAPAFGAPPPAFVPLPPLPPAPALGAQAPQVATSRISAAAAAAAAGEPAPQQVFDDDLLAELCAGFTIGPLIDFPAMGRKLMRVTYKNGTTGTTGTTNYYFAYLSQSEGMFRVFFVLNPAGGIEKGIDYIQATLLEICLQYFLNKLHNELLNLPPRNIRTAQELGDFIKKMSTEDSKQYIKIHPGFTPVFSRVSNDFRSQQLDLPLMYYFTTVGLIYGNGVDQVRSFSELVYDPKKHDLLQFLQDGAKIPDVPPVLSVLTGAFLNPSDYAASGKYKNELVTCKKYKNELNFNNGAPDLGNMVHNMDSTSYLAHVPSETIRWNMDAMRSNTRLRNRLLPDNYEQLAILEMQLLTLLLDKCPTLNKPEYFKDNPSHLQTLNADFVDLLSRLLIQPGTINPKGGLTCQILTNDLSLPEVQKLLGLELQKILGVDEIDQQKFIDLIILKIRIKFQVLSQFFHLLGYVTCNNLSLMQKIVKFITELKMTSDPQEKLEKYKSNPYDTSFDIREIRDLHVNCGINLIEFIANFDWIKRWFNLWERVDINAANEILQRITEGIGAVNKGRGVDEIKLKLLERIIDKHKNIVLTSVCYSIFLVASFLMIIQDKISTEISFPTPSHGSTCLNIYKGVLNNAIIRSDVIDLLKNLAKKLTESIPPEPDSPKFKEIMDLIEGKDRAITATIEVKDKLKQDMAQTIQTLLVSTEFPYSDRKFKEKVESLLVPVATAAPLLPRSITEDMYQQSKLFKNYAENENFTKQIFESEYGMDTKPTVKLYCFGTKQNRTKFHALNDDPVSHPVSIIPTTGSGINPTKFNSSFDNWYFDVPRSGGNSPQNATVFTVSVMYALELLYTMNEVGDIRERGTPPMVPTNEEEDITDQGEPPRVPITKEADPNNQPAKKQAVMVGGLTPKKICILFTVSSTIVLPLPIPYTITESDIKFAIQNQITPIACIPYDDASLDINTIRKTLLGTYPRFSIYGTAFAGKPMDYVIGQHEQLPVFFKTDTYFSKYLKVCEHYCTTAPFYNWCDHKPYSYLDVGEGLPFAQYFVQLFSAEGDYASLGLDFDQTLLEPILKNRTSMVEAVTRLYTDNCAFFEKFNDPAEVVKEQKEEDYLCENANYEDELCERGQGQRRRKVPTKELKGKRRIDPAAALAADDADAMSGIAPPEVALNPPATANPMDENEGGSTSRQRQTFKRRQQGGNRTFKRHPRDKYKRKHNDDGLTKHKTSNKLRRKKSVKN